MRQCSKCTNPPECQDAPKQHVNLLVVVAKPILVSRSCFHRTNFEHLNPKHGSHREQCALVYLQLAS